MIIEFNTGKTDIVLVKAPEGYEDYKINITEELEIQLIHKMGDIQSLCACPEGNWQIVGNPFEFNEEQKRDIVTQMKDTGYPFELQDVNDTFDDMLNHLKVYRVNPMGEEEPDSEDYLTGRQYNHFLRQWQELEERTGNYVLLKKQS